MNTILRKQFLAHVGQTSSSPMLVEVARAEGSFFYTPDGKRYYDLVAGVSVSNVGHCNPDVVRAVQEQAARYMHVMVYGEMVESPQVTYAARIAAVAVDVIVVRPHGVHQVAYDRFVFDLRERQQVGVEVVDHARYMVDLHAVPLGVPASGTVRGELRVASRRIGYRVE